MAKENVKVSNGAKEVNLYDEVKVIGAEKAKHLTPGEVYKVHPEHAQTLIEKGEAVAHKDVTVFDTAPPELRSLDNQVTP